MTADTEDSSPGITAAWILWGSRSEDQLRFLLALSQLHLHTDDAPSEMSCAGYRSNHVSEIEPE